MLRTILTAALLTLSPSQSPAPVPAPIPADCLGDAPLPFPLPADSLTEDWCDLEWEEWANAQFDAYCAVPANAASHDCYCHRAW